MCVLSDDISLVTALCLRTLQTASTNPDMRLIGKGVYDTKETVRLGFGKVALRGYAQALNVTQSGLTLTLDPSVTAVPIAEELVAWMQVRAGLDTVCVRYAPHALMGLQPVLRCLGWAMWDMGTCRIRMCPKRTKSVPGIFMWCHQTL